MGKGVPGYKVKPNKVAALMKAKSATPVSDPEILSRCDTTYFDNYILNDGSLLLVFKPDGMGVVYLDPQQYVEMIDSIPSNEELNAMVYPFNLTFPNEVDFLSQKLFVKLNLKVATNNNSIDSLKQIDKAVHKLLKDQPEQKLFPELYEMLVACCCKILRQHFNGEVRMMQHPNFDNLFIPEIIANDGHKYHAAQMVYDEIEERPKTFSTYKTMQVLIYKYGFEDLV